LKLVCVVGARPNFMKIAPVMRALAHREGVSTVLVHTGQHYDVAMNSRFFEQLSIPAPDVSLEVGSGTHAVQTAEIMRRFEPVLDAERPDAVVVVGDVNSTLACALVAAKKGIRVVHVEAGLRSRDRTMPEEINRLLTDQLSDRLYVTERSALANLAAEGIDPARAVFAGNVMIDTLLASRPRAVPPRDSFADAGAPGFATDGRYALLTLHRPSNVDEPATLRTILTTMQAIGERVPVAFPVHPRTRERIASAGLESLADGLRLLALPPQGYLEMLGLMSGATLVLTDSGGLQEESTALGIPCLTLRDNTERPITVTDGTNTLVGNQADAILAGVDAVLAVGGRQGHRPEYWDGRAAERIVDDLLAWLASMPVGAPAVAGA
jgi:UDP-N-acetylglucosamine 2-epimerase (non-hydrolysing)